MELVDERVDQEQLGRRRTSSRPRLHKVVQRAFNAEFVQSPSPHTAQVISPRDLPGAATTSQKLRLSALQHAASLRMLDASALPPLDDFAAVATFDPAAQGRGDFEDVLAAHVYIMPNVIQQRLVQHASRVSLVQPADLVHRYPG